MKTTCEICPHFCNIEECHTGLCRARTNKFGKIVCSNYGKITSISLDPIEKKPLARYMPGSMILSIGSYGCNLRCPFCQNCDISMAAGNTVQKMTLTPDLLTEKAAESIPEGNIGLAYTYNEPLIGYEFVKDCAELIHEKDLKNVIVTNGYVCEEPLRKLLPLIDAMNIDLKGFTEQFYKKLGGDIETVKHTIEIASKECHVEVTTLVIPGENDSTDEIDALSAWLASVSDEIPLHISRFFPRYKYKDRTPTPVNTIYSLAEIARSHLKYVYTGNC